MKDKIMSLKINVELINIKGTTTEKLGFLGREEGIACQSMITVSKKNGFTLGNYLYWFRNRKNTLYS